MSLKTLDIHKIIDKYLPVRIKEKNKSGEVFTPRILINEMLDKLPTDVWKNKDLRWLDPANGIGNFPLLVYERLMKGLQDTITDDDNRHDHIIKNMLFMVELNERNYKISREIFGGDANIYLGSFLDDGWYKEFNVEHFDIICGNPPYNSGGVHSSKKGTVQSGLKTIWGFFVSVSLDKLKKDGYLLFIHPLSWFNLGSGISKRMIEKQIIYIKSYTSSASCSLFGGKTAQIPIAYYLLKNTNTRLDTKIYEYVNDCYTDFNIYKYNFIPNTIAGLIKKVLIKTNGNSISKYVLNTQHKDSSLFNDTRNNEYKYPLIRYCNHKITLSYSKKCYRHHNNKQKLIMPNFSMGFPILDINGLLDTGGSNNFCITTDDTDKLKKIQKLLLTPLSLTIIQNTKTSMDFMDKRIFDILPDPVNIDFDIFDKNKLYEYFNLSQNEINIIINQENCNRRNLTKEQLRVILEFDIYNYLG
jgi:hypothetical protein